MDKAEPLVIRNKLHQSEDSSSNLISLEWSIENISSKSVEIYGYRLYFVGILNDQEIVRNIPEKFQTNPHVITTLWEGESRSYLWKKVHPKYYGITKPGLWYYLLQIAYLVEGRNETQKTDWVSSNKLHFDMQMISDSLEFDYLKELGPKIPDYLQEKFHLKTKPKCVTYQKIGVGHMLDQMCYTKDGWVAVIEYKKTASLDSLLIVNFYLNKVTPKYARNPESAVGIIVAQQFDEPFLAKIREFPQIHYVRVSDL